MSSSSSSASATAAAASTTATKRKGRENDLKEATGTGGDEGTRGMKHLTIQVMRLLEERKVATYTEIGDAIEREEALEGAEGAKRGEGNRRRRVYDVLNVLVAMGLLRRDNKSVFWVGEPRAPGQKQQDNTSTTKGDVGRKSVTRSTSAVAQQSAAATRTAAPAQFLGLTAEIDRMKEAVSLKRQELSALLVHHLLLNELVRENAKRKKELSSSSSSSSSSNTAGGEVKLPFILITTGKDTPVNVQMSSDKSSAIATFDGPFEVHDDVEILNKMNLLDNVTRETLSEIIPEELFPLLPADIAKRLDVKFAAAAQQSNEAKRAKTVILFNNRDDGEGEEDGD